MIKIHNIFVKYEENFILKNISLEFKKNTINSIIGLSGSGKTTLLKTINKINIPSRGEILINDVNLQNMSITEIRSKIGYGIQGKSLFPFLNVEENLKYYYKAYKKTIQINSLKKLFTDALLNYDEYKNKYPHEMSGGEKQRIILLILISMNLEVILLDEPFSALDPYSKKLCQDLVIKAKLNTTIVIVSHDPQEVLKMSNQISIIKDHEIKISGTPEKILKSNLPIVKNFFGDLVNGEDDE